MTRMSTLPIVFEDLFAACISHCFGGVWGAAAAAQSIGPRGILQLRHRHAVRRRPLSQPRYRIPLVIAVLYYKYISQADSNLGPLGYGKTNTTLSNYIVTWFSWAKAQHLQIASQLSESHHIFRGRYMLIILITYKLDPCL